MSSSRSAGPPGQAVAAHTGEAVATARIRMRLRVVRARLRTAMSLLGSSVGARQLYVQASRLTFPQLDLIQA